MLYPSLPSRIHPAHAAPPPFSPSPSQPTRTSSPPSDPRALPLSPPSPSARLRSTASSPPTALALHCTTLRCAARLRLFGRQCQFFALLPLRAAAPSILHSHQINPRLLLAPTCLPLARSPPYRNWQLAIGDWRGRGPPLTHASAPAAEVGYLPVLVRTTSGVLVITCAPLLHTARRPALYKYIHLDAPLALLVKLSSTC